MSSYHHKSFETGDITSGLTEDQLLEMARTGLIKKEDFIHKDGHTWHKADTVKGIEEILKSRVSFSAGTSEDLLMVLPKAVSLRDDSLGAVAESDTNFITYVLNSDFATRRLKNVIERVDSEHKFAQLNTSDALRSFSKLDKYLRSLGSYGAGTSANLFKTLGLANQSTDSIPAANVLSFLAELELLYPHLDWKYLLSRVPIAHPIFLFSTEEALLSWGIVEDALEIHMPRKNGLHAIKEAMTSLISKSPTTIIQEFGTSMMNSKRMRNCIDSIKDSDILNRSVAWSLDNWHIFEKEISRLSTSSVGNRSLRQFHDFASRLKDRNKIDCNIVRNNNLLHLHFTSSQFYPSNIDKNIFTNFPDKKISKLNDDEWNSKLRFPFLFSCNSYFDGWFSDSNNQILISEKGYSAISAWAKRPALDYCFEWKFISILLEQIHTKNIFGVILTHELRELGVEIPSSSTHLSDQRVILIQNASLKCIIDTYYRLQRYDLEDCYEHLENNLFNHLTSHLVTRDANIIRDRFVNEYTLEECGKRSGITREGVRQICTKWNKYFIDNKYDSIFRSFLDRKANSLNQILSNDFDSPNYPSPDCFKQLVLKFKLVFNVLDIDEAVFHSRFILNEDFVFKRDDIRVSVLEKIIDDFLSTKGSFPCYLPSEQLNTYPKELVKSLINRKKLFPVFIDKSIYISDEMKLIDKLIVSLDHAFRSKKSYFLTEQELYESLLQSPFNFSKKSIWRYVKSYVNSDSSKSANAFVSRNENIMYRFISNVGLLSMTHFNEYSIFSYDCKFITPFFVDKIDFVSSTSKLGKLYNLISKNGIIKFGGLGKIFEEEGLGTAGDAAFLGDNPFFFPAHPSYVCVNSTNGKIANTDAIIEKLLTNEALTTYLQMRIAGFMPYDFPAWSKELLIKWKEWFKTNIDIEQCSKLFKLLDDDIENYGTHEERSFVEESFDYDLLETCRRTADASIPSIDDLFNALVIAGHLGFLNQYLVNESCQTHRESHTAVSMLSILLAIGAVDKTNHWQKPHVFNDIGRSWLSDLVNEFNSSSKLNWTNNSTAIKIKDSIATKGKNLIEGTWVNLTEFHRLSNVITSIDDTQRSRYDEDNTWLKFNSSEKILPLKGDRPMKYITPGLRSILDFD